MSSEPNAYDVFDYRAYAFMETHPARLATMASFYGMAPAPISRCRVLELGGGTGGNLVPMAYQFPDSEFLGIDLSARSIERGVETVAVLGLRNIELRHADILEVSADYGRFDYIIAHGVYSWVPAEVRQKIMAILRENLAPQGVAYISYNALPGAHLRAMARDSMLFHVRDIAAPQERLDQARGILKVLSEASDKTTVHGVVMRDQYGRVERMGNDTLYHDDLDEGSASFPLYQVVGEAERHGLQYLSDASLWRRSLARLPERLRAMLARFPAEGYMTRDQYHDFIDGHGFRRTLLCHGEIQLDRDVKPTALRRFHLASSLAPTTANVDPAQAGMVEFKSEAGETLSTDHKLTKAALLHLGQSWPGAVHFDDLVAQARSRLATEAPESCSDADVEAVTENLFELVNDGQVEFYLFPSPFVTAIGERPEVSLLVRKQIALGPMVTSLRHDSVALENDMMRQFVQLIDGTRSLDQIVMELGELAARAQAVPEGKAVTREVVEHNLKALAKLALLVR